MSFCSPRQLRSKKKKASTKSCLDEDIVDEMFQIFKIKNPAKTASNPMLAALKNEMPCEEEQCLAFSTTLNPIRNKILENFRPPVPEGWKNNPKTWLNTNDILDVLNQYEMAFDDFKFLAVSPIDFDTRLNENGQEVERGGTCVDRSLCSLNLARLLHSEKKITRIGAVFNLDKHNESGSHWTSMFADLLTGEFYYFDSVAGAIPDEVIDLADRFVSQGNKLVHEGIHKIEQSPEPRLHIKNGKITVPKLCNYLMQNDNFALYRYANMFPVEQRFKIETDVSQDIAQKIVGNVLKLIDKTEQERYASINNLDELSTHLKKGSVDEFVFDWVNANLSIAINHLLDSIKIVDDGAGLRTKVIDIQFRDNAFYFSFENPNAQTATVSDVSFKAFANFVQHQFKNTECGMYSINFIDNFLFKNKTFFEIINNPVNDTDMNQMRYTKYFFSI
jgi:hypothetical protein